MVPPYASVWRVATAPEWTAAALDAIAAGGLGAVGVEPLAAKLGTTKGSFYWHFRNRDALLEAALHRWEQTDTEDVITLVEAEPDLRRRLRLLLTTALGDHPEHREHNAVEMALQATAGHPLVAPVLARVTRRRLAYLVEVFAALGFADAEQRSLLAYTAYLGHAQLVHAAPGVAPQGRALAGYVDAVIARLTAS